MRPKKIYTTNKNILEALALDLNIGLDYLGRGVGEGYCTSEGVLRVFVTNSEVDTSDKFEDVTTDYK